MVPCGVVKAPYLQGGETACDQKLLYVNTGECHIGVVHEADSMPN